MKKYLLPFTLLFLFFNSNAQDRIDGDFAFQTDPAKKYSIYVPSGYDANTPHTMMLGLHPFNTNRWDSESWCDTLITFAEANNLLLVCPDGGVDGKVDDPIDTAFTTVLLDSMEIWYNVNPEKIYAMGFSWGGKTVYTYGLNHINRFRGFMPIGAAVNVSEISGVESNAAWHPYYLVHGANDSPGVRFTPLKNTMEDNDACVNSLLMPGVGHTIDFPNRNQILTDAFQWIDTVTCSESTAVLELLSPEKIIVFPNPASVNELLQITLPSSWMGNIELEIINIDGKIIQKESIQKTSTASYTISTPITKCPTGTYFLLIKNEKGGQQNVKFQIH